MSMPPDRVDAQPWPSKSAGWYAVAALWFAYVVSYVDRLALTFLVDPIKRDLGVTDTEMSLLIGFSFAVFYSALGIPIARYADRGRRVRLIVIGVLVWSAMTAACGFAQGFLALLAARIGVAVGEAVLQPTALSLISDFFRKDQKAAPISAYLTASFAGTAIAYAVGGSFLAFAETWDIASVPVLRSMEPWQITFLLVALPGLLAALLIAMIREPARRERAYQTRRPGEPDAGVSWRELGAILKRDSRAYATIIGGPLLFCVYVFGLLVWLPSVLTRIHSVPAAEAGALIGGAFLLGGPLGVMGSSWLAQRRVRQGTYEGVMRTALHCNLLGIVPGIAVVLAPNGTVAAIAFFVFVLVGCGMTSLPQAALQMLAPNEVRAQVAALWGLGVNLFGLGLGPTIAALISDAIDPTGSSLHYGLAAMGVPLLITSGLVIAWGLPAVRHSFETRAREPVVA